MPRFVASPLGAATSSGYRILVAQEPLSVPHDRFAPELAPRLALLEHEPEARVNAYHRDLYEPEAEHTRIELLRSPHPRVLLLYDPEQDPHELVLELATLFNLDQLSLDKGGQKIRDREGPWTSFLARKHCFVDDHEALRALTRSDRAWLSEALLTHPWVLKHVQGQEELEEIRSRVVGAVSSSIVNLDASRRFTPWAMGVVRNIVSSWKRERERSTPPQPDRELETRVLTAFASVQDAYLRAPAHGSAKARLHADRFRVWVGLLAEKRPEHRDCFAALAETYGGINKTSAKRSIERVLTFLVQNGHQDVIAPLLVLRPQLGDLLLRLAQGEG